MSGSLHLVENVENKDIKILLQKLFDVNCIPEYFNDCIFLSISQ